MSLVTNFKNFFSEFIGGSPDPELVLECPVDKTLMLLSLDICNILTTGVQIDVIIYDSSEDMNYFLLKNTPIPVGSTLQVISKQKHVLESGDNIKIFCNMSDSVNVIGSYMDVYTD